MSGACPTAFSCWLCSGKHNTLLHEEVDKPKTDSEQSNEGIGQGTAASSCNAQFAGTTRVHNRVAGNRCSQNI